jgi:hypothetical protein
MYQKALDKMRQELDAPVSSTLQKEEKPKGFVSPRLNVAPQEESDPLEISKQWISVIRSRAEGARKKAEAQRQE